ncbi:MAG: ZIP family metal transporter [Parcubacteria group bacterium]
MIWLYSIASVVIVSLISLIGAVTLALKKERLEKLLLYLVSLSVGALFGDVFLHILPEISEEGGFGVVVGVYFLIGIVLFFIIEKFVHWHHCHHAEHEHKVKPVAVTNLIGDGFHNFLDGMVIAAAFLVSVPVGIATALAVVFHEIPQEIGDFGVLLYSGLSAKKALLFNFLSGALAVAGAVLVLLTSKIFVGLDLALLAVAGGGFIYIAGSDLIPEMHKECRWNCSLYQLIMILVGIGLMATLLLFE